MGSSDFVDLKDNRSYAERKKDKSAKPHVDFAYERLNSESKNKYSGIGNRLSPGFVPNFNKAQCEEVIQGKSTNSWIVLGKDRPQGLASGYGGLGADQCGAIDICVGRLSVLSLDNVKNSFNSLSKDEIDITSTLGSDGVADNDFKADAARIYISERTRVDENFGIAVGKAGGVPGLSAIAIKADQLRFIAREGIKLVTRTDDTNSKGGTADVVLGIDLIAGNDDSDMQPLVKGKNLKELLYYMLEDIQHLTSMVHSLTISTISLESMLAAHTHVTNTAGIVPGVSIPSIELGVFVANSQVKKAILDIPSHYKKIIENAAMEIEFLKPAGARYINSRSNHTN